MAGKRKKAVEAPGSAPGSYGIDKGGGVFWKDVWYTVRGKGRYATIADARKAAGT